MSDVSALKRNKEEKPDKNKKLGLKRTLLAAAIGSTMGTGIGMAGNYYAKKKLRTMDPAKLKVLKRAAPPALALLGGLSAVVAAKKKKAVQESL
jgi:hypothetical protein